MTRPYEVRWLHTMIVVRDGQEFSRTLDERSIAELRGMVGGADGG